MPERSKLTPETPDHPVSLPGALSGGGPAR